jgi:hypothetical protein
MLRLKQKTGFDFRASLPRESAVCPSGVLDLGEAFLGYFDMLYVSPVPRRGLSQRVSVCSMCRRPAGDLRTLLRDLVTAPAALDEMSAVFAVARCQAA